MIKIVKKYSNEEELAKVYYKILFSISEKYSLRPTEIDLVAFTSVRGFITTKSALTDFLEKSGSTKNYVYTIVSKLQREGILIKEKGIIKVNPKICLKTTEGKIDLAIRLMTEDGKS